MYEVFAVYRDNPSYYPLRPSVVRNQSQVIRVLCGIPDVLYADVLPIEPPVPLLYSPQAPYWLCLRDGDMYVSTEV